jgi:tetratricopeptide (TPR) repeat protein
MWQDGSNEESLWEQLHQLNETPVVPEFTRELYGLMVEWSAEANDSATRELTWRLLEVELRYYRQLHRLNTVGSVGGLTTESADEKRQIALELLYERARARGFRPEANAEVARQLVMAECAYHLGRTDAVVAHLEQAMDSGAPDPLLYFALGYARFMLALSCVARLEAPGANFGGASRETIRQLCLAAVTAFEGALTGGPRDAKILWWIGRVLLAAGFEDAAQEALTQAEAHDSSGEEWEPQAEILRRDTEPGLVEPISDHELARFIEAIKHPHPISKLL